MNKFILSVLILFCFLNITYSQNMNIKERFESFKPVTLSADLSRLSDKEKKIIPILIEVAKIMDDLFWMQNYGDKDKFLNGIQDEYEKKFAFINYGPWDQLDNEKSFCQRSDA